NKEERKQFLEELKNRSIFNLTTNLSVNDSLLFISVDYQEKDDFETERVVVIAKKLENSADEKAIKELSNNPNVIYPFALSGTIPTYTTTTTKTHKQVTTTTTKKTTQNYVVKRTTKRPTQKPTTKPVIVTSPTTIQTTAPPEEVTTTETQEDTTTTAQEPEENFNS
ncbi:MAG: hypothetical protein J6Z00_04165, partial [Clostridia bacterium]|nr:hypothetical protein [Clostridia bacterium]